MRESCAEAEEEWLSTKGYVVVRVTREASVKVRLVLLVLLLPVIVSCAGSGGNRENGLAVVTVQPTSGPPGTPLEIFGLEISELDDSTDVDEFDFEGVEAWLGNEQALLIVREDGTVASAVPLYLGENDWPAPPTAPQTLELRRGDTVLARSSTGVTVRELERAPGTGRAVQEALVEITAGYETLLSTLPVTQPQDRPLREATVAMLEGLFDPESALMSAPESELVDALLASSGALEYYQTYAQSLGETQAQLNALALAGICEDEGEDIELACLMQIHTVLKDYAEIVVNPTATSYSYWVGLPGGLLGLAGVSVPAAGIVGAFLSMADFVMNKLVPGLLPSEISRFDLELDDETIFQGEITGATITLAATNAPPAISIADLAEQLLTLVGLASYPKGMDEFRQQLYDLVKFELDLFYKILRVAEDGFPGTFPDLNEDNVHVPKMTWGPVEVTNERLVTLFSYEPDIASPVPEGEGLKWRGVDPGQATVRVQPRGPGEKSKLLKDHVLCRGCIYSGGAFGLDSTTAQAELTVVGVSLGATPTNGKAPLTTTFSWHGLPEGPDAFSCLLDPGDGSTPYRVHDCAATTSLTHTYTETSRLRNGPGVYEAQIVVEETELQDSLELNVGWTFEATPTEGDAPLGVTFTWSGLGGGASGYTCSLDPGDGAPHRSVSCEDGSSTSHTYSEEGVHPATLFVYSDAVDDFSTRMISVNEGEPQDCSEMAEVTAWQATVQYTHSRDVSGETSSYTDHVIYEVSADISALLEQSRPGQASWADEAPGGSASVSVEEHHHGEEHDTYYTFSGSGTPIPHDPSVLTGSRMSLFVGPDCQFGFYLKASVAGSGTSYDEPFEGRGSINTVRGYFGGASRSISGSYAFPLYESSDIVHQPDAPEVWILERSDVADMLDGNLGTVMVTYSFTAVGTSAASSTAASSPE